MQVTLRKDEARYPSINSLDACILQRLRRQAANVKGFVASAAILGAMQQRVVYV